MNEMEAPVAGNDYGHDDESVNELIRKHGVRLLVIIIK